MWQNQPWGKKKSGSSRFRPCDSDMARPVFDNFPFQIRKVERGSPASEAKAEIDVETGRGERT
jgi:hypothetical protein